MDLILLFRVNNLDCISFVPTLQLLIENETDLLSHWRFNWKKINFDTWPQLVSNFWLQLILTMIWVSNIWRNYQKVQSNLLEKLYLKLEIVFQNFSHEKEVFFRNKINLGSKLARTVRICLKLLVKSHQLLYLITLS